MTQTRRQIRRARICTGPRLNAQVARQVLQPRYDSVVANLKSLIGLVQASIALVETAIARELSDGNQEAADIKMR